MGFLPHFVFSVCSQTYSKHVIWSSENWIFKIYLYCSGWVIYFIVYVHLSECFSNGLQTPTDRKQELNQISHSDIHEFVNLHRESQWKVWLFLIVPTFIYLNAEYGQKAYTMWVYAHFSEALSPFVPHLFHNLKRFCTAPQQTLATDF